MAKTPYEKIGSQDILSAHINGLQFAVNNLEDALNLKTQVVTGHALTPVTDMDDPTIRYRIYEGNVRNWLKSPAPVVMRNGAVVDSEEYVIQPAYGVVVFHAQQNVDATISVNFTYVINESTRLETIERNVNANGTSISEVSRRVTTLEETGGGLSSYPTQMFAPIGSWISNNKDSTATLATEVVVGSGATDAFPVVLNEPMTIDEMKVIVSPSNKKTANIYCGIYTDKNAYPHELLATTGKFRVDITDPGVSVELIQPLTAPITLDAGVYWLARYTNDGVSFDGWNQSGLFDFYEPPTDYVNGASGKVAGVRADKMGNITALPAIFPQLDTGNNKYLRRSVFGGIYIKRA